MKTQQPTEAGHVTWNKITGVDCTLYCCTALRSLRSYVRITLVYFYLFKHVCDTMVYTYVGFHQRTQTALLEARESLLGKNGKNLTVYEVFFGK